jgi:hypothetical protein
MPNIKQGAIRWLSQVGLALTRLGNALLGGLAEESMSSRAWRMETKHKPWGRITRPVIDFAFEMFGRNNHCENAYHAERNKAPLPQ